MEGKLNSHYFVSVIGIESWVEYKMFNAQLLLLLILILILLHIHVPLTRLGYLSCLIPVHSASMQHLIMAIPRSL